MLGDVVHLKLQDDLVTLGTPIRLVPQDLRTEGLPLGGAVPAPQGVVGAGVFRPHTVRPAFPCGREHGTTGDGTVVGGGVGHYVNRKRGGRAGSGSDGSSGSRSASRSGASSGSGSARSGFLGFGIGVGIGSGVGVSVWFVMSHPCA